MPATAALTCATTWPTRDLIKINYNRGMLNIYELTLLLPVILGAVYWWRASEQKRVAVAGAREYCRERNLQLLDETLVFKRLRLDRDQRNKRRLLRIYEFDYSMAGQDRDSGEIILKGDTILRVILNRQNLEITEFRR